MPTLIQCIHGEIQTKGKAYFVVESHDGADFHQAMEAAFAQAETLGARELHIASRAEGFFLTGDAVSIAGRSFLFDTNFWILKKDLEFNPSFQGTGTIKIKKLANWNLDLFMAQYNECFFSVPNSRTMTREAGESLLLDDKREAGFFMEGGAPIGVFEVHYFEPTPEIASIALLDGHRGKGMGKAALELLERRIAQRGHSSCQVLTAEMNHSAMAMYKSCGYQIMHLLSSWYCHRIGEDA